MTPSQPSFCFLDPAPPPWKLILITWSVQAVALILIINLPLLFPAQFALPEQYMITNLVPYETTQPTIRLISLLSG